ncbi:MAG: L,D-transpeptidase, partial [Myxococcota bacterium]
GGGRRLRTLGRRTAVRVRAIERRWAELEDGGFVRVRDLHRPERQPAPEDATTWIDIDISEQTLVAYRGETPVYATLISSGRRGRHHATPIGEHRVWVKLAFSDMDNLQRENVARNYAIERVPWVQYFAGANGLHAAFWHDEFGRRKSHGCINLAPRDAQALFAFTEPALPTGWTAIFPRPDEPTTVVVVRP